MGVWRGLCDDISQTRAYSFTISAKLISRLFLHVSSYYTQSRKNSVCFHACCKERKQKMTLVSL